MPLSTPPETGLRIGLGAGAAGGAGVGVAALGGGSDSNPATGPLVDGLMFTVLNSTEFVTSSLPDMLDAGGSDGVDFGLAAGCLFASGSVAVGSGFTLATVVDDVEGGAGDRVGWAAGWAILTMFSSR